MDDDDCDGVCQMTTVEPENGLPAFAWQMGFPVEHLLGHREWDRLARSHRIALCEVETVSWRVRIIVIDGDRYRLPEHEVEWAAVLRLSRGVLRQVRRCGLLQGYLNWIRWLGLNDHPVARLMNEEIIRREGATAMAARVTLVPVDGRMVKVVAMGGDVVESQLRPTLGRTATWETKAQKRGLDVSGFVSLLRAEVGNG